MTTRVDSLVIEYKRLSRLVRTRIGQRLKIVERGIVRHCRMELSWVLQISALRPVLIMSNQQRNTVLIFRSTWSVDYKTGFVRYLHTPSCFPQGLLGTFLINLFTCSTIAAALDIFEFFLCLFHLFVNYLIDTEHAGVPFFMFR